ncbi:hypothetical protein EZJ49_09400 [Bdellovibrio bacteriovorus]|uniref:hypothetical protein n=1 Tax=Bdellovibrio bacteriovorus TaxID=959 RepID=UPI0021D2AF3F|nr:hypothetical protein [Bdellovibrio bacteriovorus]UXR63291.1 hypothetical protein EZJ49_09400 [Bdellovibrio bacteriovorus]
MKTFNSKLIFLLAAFSLMGVGCGKSNQFQTGSNNTNQPIYDGGIGGEAPAAPDGGGTSSGSTSGGNVVDFVPVSFAEMNSYVGIRPLNNPSNYKLTIDLENVGSNRYGGTVKLSYVDTGYSYTGTFDSGLGTNVKMSGLQDNNMLEAEYNRWFTYNGKTVFNGFFQDQYGAIVVVIDKVVNQGDGQGSSTVSGSVYYKNFGQSYVQQSPYRKCWYIRSGPYNCRASAVMNKTSPYPADGYRKLGTFSGLVVSEAFK